MKTSTWLIAFVALVLIGMGLWGIRSMQSAPAATNTDIIAGVPDATYTNSHLSFSIRYPSTATSSEFDFEGYLPLTQTPVASFVLPKSMSAGTNLGDAGVYIGATTTPSVMQTCETAPQNSGETVVGTTTIGGQTFAVFGVTEAGVGNIYETKSYRAVKNGTCIELLELLHSGNIGNYPDGMVVEYDHAKFSQILDVIVHTYKSL